MKKQRWASTHGAEALSFVCDEFDRYVRDHMKIREIEDSMLNTDEN
jgi:hypothetical protein